MCIRDSTSTDPKVTSTNGITLAETTTGTASLISLTNTQPGLYQLTAYQNNQPIAAPLSFTVLTPPYPQGTDDGGSNPSNPGNGSVDPESVVPRIISARAYRPGGCGNLPVLEMVYELSLIHI